MGGVSDFSVWFGPLKFNSNGAIDSCTPTFASCTHQNMGMDIYNLVNSGKHFLYGKRFEKKKNDLQKMFF